MWSAIGVGGRALVSLATFTLLARTLGVDGFGRYAGVLALATLTPAVATLASQQLATRSMRQRHRSSSVALGLGLRLTAVAAPLTAALATVAVHLLVPSVSLGVAAALVVAEILHVGVSEIPVQIRAAQGDYRTSTLTILLNSVIRLVAVVFVVAAVSSPTITHVAVALLLAALAASSVSITWLVRDIGAPREDRAWRSQLADGGWLSISSVTLKMNNDIDQTVLLRLASAGDAGIYAAASRIAQYAFLPVQAALRVTFPRFLDTGADGVEPATAYLRRLLPRYAALGLAMSVGVLASRPIVEKLLGGHFTASGPIIWALAGFPLLRTIQSLFGDVLTAIEHYADRTAIVALGAAGNLASNLVLVPRYGWAGAVAATYLSESAMTLGLVGRVTQLRTVARREAIRLHDPVESGNYRS